MSSSDEPPRVPPSKGVRVPGKPVPKSPIPRLHSLSGEPSGDSKPPTGSPGPPRSQPVASDKPAKRNTPLHRHSLKGDGAKLAASATDTKPFLGDFVMFGQSTMIYAQANSGKTLSAIGLVLEAIELGRIDADDVLYINADDTSKGLAEKVQIFEAPGAHMLAPGRKGLKASELFSKLKLAAEDGTARGTVVIIDTLKKFANLMHKGESSEVAQVCREYVLAGGTILALGHTAKSPNPDGTPRYQGTTDILDDFDAVYVAEPMSGKSGSNERIIRFTQRKSRAESPETVAYAFSTEAGLTYEEKVASLRLVYPEELDGHQLEVEQLDDEEVIKSIRAYLISGHGHVGEDKMIRALARDGDISRTTAKRILTKYTGSDPDKHLWDFHKGDRGKREYYLLNANRSTPAP